MATDITGLGSIADLASNVINKVWPDKSEQEKAELAIAATELQGAIASQQGQLEINKKEAESQNLFVAGWRPAAGWVCVVTLALTYIPKALVLATFWCFQAYAAIRAGQGLPIYPDVGLTDVLGLLFSLLGVASLRTVEKVKKVN
jgi:hypothetical protein